MTTPMTMLCPGQGAQAVGMGKAWADAHPESKAIFDRADALAAQLGTDIGTDLGGPLSELCFKGPAERLNKTDASQPAIFTASVASYHGLCAVAGYDPEDPAKAPQLAAAAGLSLGEYTALCVAGALSFEDGLRLVTLRGRAMQDAAEANPSSMVALIGADEDSAAELCERALKLSEEQTEGKQVLTPANFNAPGQVVVSGSIPACEAAEQVAGEMSLRATRLAVAGAFHSPLMQPAAERLTEALAATTFNTPRCPVLSNVTGKPHEDDADSIRARLVEQLTSPVRWADNCRWLAENTTGATLFELAPGKTLSGLMRRIDKSMKVQSQDAPA